MLLSGDFIRTIVIVNERMTITDYFILDLVYTIGTDLKSNIYWHFDLRGARFFNYEIKVTYILLLCFQHCQSDRSIGISSSNISNSQGKK